MSDGLGLHGGVDADPLQTGGPHGACVEPGLDRSGQQCLQSFWSKPLAPARQRAGITRQLMLEVLAATEPLPIGILDEALHHRLIGQVEGVLEIRQPDHQARRLGAHGKTPAFGGSLPRSWHSTMLREDKESFSLNQLWVISGPTVYRRV